MMLTRNNSNDLQDVLIGENAINPDDVKGRVSPTSSQNNEEEPQPNMSPDYESLKAEEAALHGMISPSIELAGMGSLITLNGRSRANISVTGKTSPTLVRAVDSSVMLALKSTGKDERMAKKRAAVRNKQMDLSDLISRLENKQR